MSQLLPQYPAIRVIQTPGQVRKASLERLDHLVVVLPARPGPAAWRQVPEHRALQSAARRVGADELIHGRLSNARATGVTVSRLPAKPQDSFTRLRHAATLIGAALRDGPASIGLLVTGLDERASRDLVEALLLAVNAHAFRMPDFRSKPDKRRRLARVQLLGLAERLDLTRSEVEADSVNLARWLTALPPNRLDAAEYRALVAALAEAHGWTMRVLDEAALGKLGAGAFLAVAQGNASRDAGIIHLRRTPRGHDPSRALALVGKGIVFDTGGNNLKPFKAMLDMHEDMAGSAVALATMQALTRLDYPHRVDCWLAITENRISATAYKSRDVVTASNGLTIEVVHTDAEGRMALADTLALAGRESPAVILDYATLTGACLHALTDRYSGVFTNREQLNQLLMETGRAVGERVWPFPMDADFEEDLKSKVADLLQCSVDGGGDHILAARFLQRFLPEGAAWAHVDLSAASRKAGLGQVPGGPTGFGVRLSLGLLVDRAEALAASLGG
jgi:leucyl aminopeptidase